MKGNKKMIRILGTCLLILSSHAFSADWGFFTESKGVKQYFDRDSLQINDSQNTVVFWEKRTGNLGVEKGKPVNKYIAMDKFYCSEKTYQILEMHVYDKAGNVIKSDTKPTGKIKIVPDSISENMFMAACEDSRK